MDLPITMDIVVPWICLRMQGGHRSTNRNTQSRRGVHKNKDPYGWYRNGPIAPDFEIDQVLPHLFDKSIAYIKSVQMRINLFPLSSPPRSAYSDCAVPPFKGMSKMNPYADFVVQVDHHMGDLFKALKSAGMDDNTLVFSPVIMDVLGRLTFRCSKVLDMIRVADIVDPSQIYMKVDTAFLLLPGWLTGSTNGQHSRALVCLTDLYSTLAGIIGKKMDDQAGEDSFSLLPLFDGKQKNQRTTLVGHSIDGSFAIRKNNWKLCLSAGSGGWNSK